MTSQQRSGVLRWLCVLCALIPSLSLSPARANAARAAAWASVPPTFTVNSLADVAPTGNLANGVCETAPGNGICTLRAAVIKANHYPGGGVTILLPASASSYTIQIPQVPGTYGEADGDFNLNANMTLAGGGASSTVVEGNQIDRLFNITSSVTVTLSGLTLRTGYDDFNGLGGGAVLNKGTLTLANSVLVSDRSQVRGGAVRNNGVMTIMNTLMDGSSAFGNGGGIYNQGTLTLQSSIVSNNEALGGQGGGIDNSGTLYVNRSTVFGNHALDFTGGGINNTGTLHVFNSTISNNSATKEGGGIYNGKTAEVIFSTIAGNLANSFNTGAYTGGGIYNASSQTVILRASLLAWNYMDWTPNDCSGNVITSGDYNYIQTVTTFPATGACFVTGVTAHNLTGADPLLDALHDNGGPATGAGKAPPTRALLAGSPAINAVPTAQCYDALGAPLTVDERGLPRPTGGACDIGAFEGSQSTPLLGRNLVRNGDAEMTAGAPSGLHAGLPYWTVVSGSGNITPTNVTYYGYWAGHLGFPTPSAPGPADHGLAFFAGGDANTATLLQTIDVSALAISIDAGQVRYQLSGYFGGQLMQNDVASASATFLDATQSGISSPSIGGFSAADRNNQTGLLLGATGDLVPAGTRTIDVVLVFNLGVGSSYNNSYADNLALVLLPAGGMTFLPAVIR